MRIEFPEDIVVKQVRYSPDKSALGKVTSDSIFRISDKDGMQEIQTGDDIFDFDFYPAFSESVPESRAVLIASRNRPMRIFSVAQKSVISAYTAYSFTEEIVHPISVRFSPTSCARILAGFPQSTVRVWDVQRPGRQSEDLVFSTKRRQRSDAQKGIISAIEFGHSDEDFFAGSYSSSIWYYDLRTDWRSSRTLIGDNVRFGGVVQLKFIPTRQLLLSGHRMDACVYGWDLRKPDSPLAEFPRIVKTNQRFEFDAIEDQFLVCGDHEGRLRVMDLTDPTRIPKEIDKNGVPLVSVSVGSGQIACGYGVRSFEPVGSEDDSEDGGDSKPRRPRSVVLVRPFHI
jgi:WD40 repeat protein